MIYLLIVHIGLGALLLVSVIARFVAVALKKMDIRTGRYYIFGLGTALVASGVVLEIAAKAPLTAACISSLAIVIAVIGYELGLEYLYSKRGVREKINIDDRN